MLKFFSALGLSTVAVFALTAQTTTNVTPTDSTFLKQAILSGDKEIAAAKAEQNSSNQYVRYFAKRMIHDHSAANAQLEALAKKDNVPIPSMPPAPSAMPGQQYMTQQVAAHKKAIALFEGEAKNGNATDIKAVVGTLLPVLHMHLHMAEQFVNTGKITPMPEPTP
jgi:putative membrane protein